MNSIIPEGHKGPLVILLDLISKKYLVLFPSAVFVLSFPLCHYLVRRPPLLCVLHNGKDVASIRRQGSSHFVYLLRLSTISFSNSILVVFEGHKQYDSFFVYWHRSVQISSFNPLHMYILIFKLYDTMYIDYDRRS